MKREKLKIGRSDYIAFDGKWLTNGKWAYTPALYGAPVLSDKGLSTLVESGTKFTRRVSTVETGPDVQTPDVEGIIPKVEDMGMAIEPTLVLIEAGNTTVRVWQSVDPGKLTVYLDVRFDPILNWGSAFAKDSANAVTVTSGKPERDAVIAVVMPLKAEDLEKELKRVQTRI